MRALMQDKRQECVLRASLETQSSTREDALSKGTAHTEASDALFWDSLVLELNTWLSPGCQRLLQVFPETGGNTDMGIFQAGVKHINICKVQMKPNPSPALPLAMEPMGACNKGRLWRQWRGWLLSFTGSVSFPGT